MENIFRSRDAKKKVEAASAEFQLRNTQILPVANYVDDDTDRIITKDILALYALDNILQQALSYMRDKIQ